MNLLIKLCLAVGFLSVFGASGLAWAQAGDKHLQESGTRSFLQPYSPEAAYQSPDNSKKPVNNKSNKSVQQKKVSKISTPVRGNAAQDSIRASFGQQQKSRNQPSYAQQGSTAAQRSVPGNSQADSVKTSSFLDGDPLKPKRKSKQFNKNTKGDNNLRKREKANNLD